MGTIKKYHFVLYISEEQEFAIRQLFLINKWDLHGKGNIFYSFYRHSCHSGIARQKPGPKVIKLFFMLNLTDHEIFPAHKC